MNRRSFLQFALAAVAAEAIPFNRVWSFPKKVAIRSIDLDIAEGRLVKLEQLRRQVEIITGADPALFGIPFYAENFYGPYMGLRQALFYSGQEYLRWQPNNISPNFGEWVPSQSTAIVE